MDFSTDIKHNLANERQRRMYVEKVGEKEKNRKGKLRTLF